MKIGANKMWFIQLVITAFSLLGALGLGAILLLIMGISPFEAYRVMLTGPFRNAFGFTEAITRAIPLLLVGLGVVISFRSGILNIGGEGQLLLGAVSGAATAIALSDLPGPILIPCVLLASFLAGGLWGAIAGFLRAKFSVSEILSTIMLNYIALQVYLFLIRGPLIDPQQVLFGTGVPQTARVPQQAFLSNLMAGTRLHSGIIIGVILAVLVFVFLWKTTTGFRMRAVGEGPASARYSGMNVEFYLILAMFLAGGFAGLAGSVEVIGVHRRAIEGLAAGYGFSGIVVALFGRLHPLGVVPAAILFGALIIGGDMMQRAVQMPAAIVIAIQGLVILFVVSSNFLLHKPELVLRALNKWRTSPGKEEEING